MNSIKKTSLFIMFCLWISSIHGVDLSFSGELSSWQEFEITSELTSLQLNIEVEGAEKEDFYISDLIDPLGNKLIKNNTKSPTRYRVPPKLYSTIKNSIRPTYVAPGLLSILIDKDVKKGSWKFRLGKKHKSTVMRAFWHTSKLKKDFVRRAVLTLDVLTASSFKKVDSITLKESLKKVQELYSSYGIEIKYSSQAAWVDPLSQKSDLEKKLKLISQKKRTHPTLYLVNRLNSTVEKDFQGLAGCLPGFQVKFVRSHCALLVSITDKDSNDFDPQKLTKVISHEIAHLLGLFHLEDDFYPFGKLLDPFEDTDSERDFINVMHKTSEFFGLLEFSQSQVRKMNSLPLLYQN